MALSLKTDRWHTPAREYEEEKKIESAENRCHSHMVRNP